MKRVIKKDHVQVTAADEAESSGGNGTHGNGSVGGARTGTARAHAPAHRGPGVHLVRIDGRVQAIELTCRCGDVSVLEIDYEETPHATEATS